MTHPAAYLPVNIGERVRFEAHGQSFLIGYHSRDTYWISTDPPGERRRWGTRRQITQDIAYVFENGALPPQSGQMWANDAAINYRLPDPSYHYVDPRVADFDTIDDLVGHAVQLGATHVLVAGAHTKLFFPRGGQYPYEEARVWRKNGYWHAEGPGARRGVHQLPQDAAALNMHIGRQRRTAEARSPRPVEDPFYVIQGIYAGGQGIISDSFGFDDEDVARSEAAKLARSPYFEGDYVRIITRDGELVWDSRGEGVEELGPRRGHRSRRR